MIMVPLWKGHSKLADYEYYDEETEEYRDLSDDIKDVLDAVISASREDEEE